MLQRLFKYFKNKRPKSHGAERILTAFKARYTAFKTLLQSNAELLNILSDLEEKLQGRDIFGMGYIRSQSSRCLFYAARMIQSLEDMSGRKYPGLREALENIHTSIGSVLEVRTERTTDFVLPYTQITKEMFDLVGGKNANLGEVNNRVQLPVPRGFAITTAAFDRFLAVDDLIDQIKKLSLEIDASDPRSIVGVSERIRTAIEATEIPEELEAALLAAHRNLADACLVSSAELRVAMRSSAIGEDTEISFAGQYLSLLNVRLECFMATYKKIIASLFSPRALTYRLHHGIPLDDLAMSVACLEMVDSVASGVMYSRHPYQVLENHVIINAVWGLGPYAVEGVVTPDSYTLSKDDFPVLLGSRVSKKQVQLVASSDGDLVEEKVAPSSQSRPCLNEEQLLTLTRYAIALEKHFQRPQDIEWSLVSDGRLIILQTRPLQIAGRSTRQSESQDDAGIPGYKVLVSGGDVACPGVGFGQAHHVRSEEDLLLFPEGGVLIAEQPSPKYLVVFPKAQAVVTDAGSITGHMAALAREFMLPAILNTRQATKIIPQGADITVDAYSGRIYQGEVSELLQVKLPKGHFMKDSPVFACLKKTAAFIVPLNLLDPKSPDFVPQRCRTIHDLMRYAHEMSYKEIFHFSELVSNEGRIAFKLDASLPLDLFIIDLGAGLDTEGPGDRSVTPAQIRCLPFKALLKGMLCEDLRSLEPRPVHLGGFISVMTRQMLSPPNIEMERFGEKSYAIISDKYMNFSSRVGYHYSVVDAYSGKNVNKNYVNFQFKGGAADDVRRNRRTRAIGRVLQKLGFTVDIKGDMVNARLNKREAGVIADALDQLGRLLVYTRQMDMLMHGEGSVNVLAECFLKGDYNLELQRDGEIGCKRTGE